MNSLIQGGAARQTKLAMRGVWQAGYCPVLQVHDELCFSISSKKHADEILEIMRDIIPLKVPMKVDGEIGESWLG
jgi:DNA polymerase I-like protein with 3'-5' exonuclease and polymerase domains